MKYIKNQVISTTGIDSHGERWTKTQLKKFYDQIKDVLHLGLEHDLANPPKAKAYNKQFVKLPNGEYAITVDIEFEDNFNINEFGGFSISATAKPSLNISDSENSVLIQYDIRNFNNKELQPIFNLSTKELEIIPNVWKRKGVESNAIIILEFASLAVVSGFFAKIGADLYDNLKYQLKELVSNRKIEEKEVPKFQILFNYNEIRTIIDISEDCLDTIDNKKVTIDSAIKFLDKNVGKSIIKQVALRLNKNEPYWEMLYFIDNDNEVIEF